MKNNIIILFFTSILLTSPRAVIAIDSAFSTGGTNYVIYNKGDSLYNGTLTLESPTGVQSVIGSYDLKPDVVRSQLQAMCTTGQRKIALVIWFLRFVSPMVPDGVYIAWRLPYINSSGDRLSPRHEQNVKNVVSLITNLKTNQGTPCFNELQFRFAPMGEAQPLGWAAWDETKYQQNWNFIYNTRNLVTSTIGSAPLTVYFDLAAEQGGQTGGQNPAYLKRLLADYNATFGIGDTYGFSIAWDPGRFQQLIQIYDQVGIRPAQHAIDFYDEGGGGMGPQLSALYNEMKNTGEQNKPVIIQETYYNDQTAYTQIMAAKDQLGMKIRTIMQWQMVRGDLHSWTIGSSFSYFDPNSPTPTPFTCNRCSVLNGCERTQFPSFTSDCAQPIPGSTVVRTLDCGCPEITGGTTSRCSACIPTPTPAIAGDLNGDGHVDLFDYNRLVTNFGTPYTIFDYSALVANFGK